MMQQIMKNDIRLIKNQQLRSSIFLLSYMIGQEICYRINFLIYVTCLYFLKALANFPIIIYNWINKLTSVVPHTSSKRILAFNSTRRCMMLKSETSERSSLRAHASTSRLFVAPKNLQNPFRHWPLKPLNTSPPLALSWLLATEPSTFNFT